MDTFSSTVGDSDSLDELAVVRAKAMFDRVLASWASDLLLLRRQGLSTPGWRECVEGDDGPIWRRAA
ncbi:MAG: hypothetical protein OSA40_03465 [Phycisphaerales bacterium]|jgi:hypothetical protein|nr:hypothetical protein [Phycisphaerales bacterium]